MQKKEQQILILVFGAAKGSRQTVLKEQHHAFVLVVKIAVEEALSPDFLLGARPVEQANTATAIASSCALHVAEGASVRSPDLLRKETAKAALQDSTAWNLLLSAFP